MLRPRWGRNRRVVGAALFLSAIGWLVPEVGEAAPGGGTVEGTVALPEVLRGAEAPPRGSGFIERTKNPFRAPRGFNPMPEIVVVLVGGTPAEEDKQPPKGEVVYRITGETFHVPMLPVVAGSAIRIVNEKAAGPVSRRLYADPAEVWEEGVLDAGGRAFKKRITKPFQVVELRDHESAHLHGRIVTMPHGYFATPDDSGRFSITGVPPGNWTVRVWYRTAWLENQDPTVQVKPRGTARVNVNLPASIADRDKSKG